MKKLRILFMGTPEFAVYILDEILKAEHTVVGVVTAPDKQAGRGQRLHFSAVKKFAEKKNLPVYQPKNLKSPDFQKDLKNLNPDIAVVVAFRMLPKTVWNYPTYGTFNLHASLLPDYRGAAPINWAIINGEKKTGVTTFFLDEQIDTGKIILQEDVEIKSEDNAGSLHDKLMTKGAALVNQTLKLISEDNFKATSQIQSQAGKMAPKLDNENTRIDWSKTPDKIYNLVRGLNPYPIAWTYFENGDKKMRCKIFEVRPESINHSHEIGEIFKSKNELKVAVDSGFIYILKMQLPGKRKMAIQDLLNGLELADKSFMF